jgi:hypothetical protein
MTAPELSSYDPIFWLHHSNISFNMLYIVGLLTFHIVQVERIFSMWQVLYAPASFEFNFEQYASLSTTAEPKGLRQTQLSPLMPFWKSKTDNHGDGLFWTSRDCQNWTVLGYDYEETGELGNWGVGGPLLRDMEKPRLTAWVNTLYRWTSPSGRVNSVTGELPNMEELHESFRPPTREIAGYPRSYKNVKCLGAHVFNDGHIWAWGFDFTDVLGSHPPNRTALLKSRTPLTVDPGPLVTRTEHEEMSRSRKPLPVVEAAWSAPLDPLREWDVHVIWQK